MKVAFVSGNRELLPDAAIPIGILSVAASVPERPETTFLDWDWRSRGKAFELPLFEKEPFLKELKVAERLKEFAAGFDKSLPQLALAWVLGNPAVSVALVGMRNERELEENIAAIDWRLSDTDRVEIDKIFSEEGVPTHVETPQAV